MRILGIETSCDETGIALYGTAEAAAAPRLLAHTVYSQVKAHAEYGGVVPELASRDHVRKILPLIRQTLADAGPGLTPRDIDGVAYTAGPGLVGALLVGATLGRALAWALRVPALAVHHMEAHLLAPLLENNPPAFPFLALLVSGGHSQLVRVDGLGEYQVLGESLDDAAGEAFDKTAKLLGLPYPGGPALARLAEQGEPARARLGLTFPRPMTDRPGLDMSFSGLKTAALTAWRKLEPTQDNAAAVARAFEDAVVETLAIKCRRALEQTGLTRLIVAGGVGANRRLRERLSELADEIGGQVSYPRPAFCTDNGAMIALAGYLRLRAGQREADTAIRVSARWSLERLGKPHAA